MAHGTSQLIQIDIRDGARHLETHSFQSGQTVTAGRSDSNDIVLKTQDISRRHCSIELLDTGYRVTDHSLNGTRTQATEKNDMVPYNTLCAIGSLQLYVHPAQPATPRQDENEIRKAILSHLIDELQIHEVGARTPNLQYRVESIIERRLHECNIEPAQRPELCQLIRDEALGLGPLEKLLGDDSVSEIMVNAPNAIYVEKSGILEKTELSFSSETAVRTAIDRIVAPLGRRVDEASPMVDARLADGSRVNAVIPPLALRGATLTIRKFSKHSLSTDDLVSFGSMTSDMAILLKEAVISRQNIIISGGTGSGKTTLLNVLSSHIPVLERIVTIEDAAELQLSQPHVVSLESRPGNSEGKGEISIRDLVKNALRMRPDRIIVGECRGSETLDMLQAMNTGHDGSLTTTHANSPTEAIARLETLTLMAGLALPVRAIREQICGAINLIVQQKRFPDGKRRITAITEVGSLDRFDRIETFDLWRFTAANSDATATDRPFQSTGRIPRFQLTKRIPE